MPASIVLAGLTFATADGRRLFTDISLTFGPERTGLVGRNGVGKSTLLRLITGELAPASGAVACSGRLAALRQVVSPAPEDTIARLFDAEHRLAVLDRANSGQADADDIAEADWTLPARMEAALARFGIDAAPETRLAELSGGQRTRAALAALVADNPDFILLDEPTNNLDRAGREAVCDLLAGWRGGALVVSHDRELLEAMDAIVDLTSFGATRYGGGWSRYSDLRARELARAESELAAADREVRAAADRAQVASERKARKDKAGRRTAKRGDQPRILLGVRKDRAEDSSGENARLADRQRREAEDAARAARARVEVLQPVSLELPSTNLPPHREVLTFRDVAAGYADAAPVIQHLSFAMAGPERVALAGQNGSGKTTLISLISGALTPRSGDAKVHVPFSVLDQRAAILERDASVLENFRRLNPAADDNAARAALARMMFRADAALQPVCELSGGQMLRAALACIIGGPQPPQLLVLDEPTNHLDLESIAAMEIGLRAYDGALLIVSHDRAFLEAVGVTRTLTLP